MSSNTNGRLVCCLAVAMLLLAASIASAQRIANPQPESDAIADAFGSAIAADAGWLLVGTPGEDSSGGANAGAVYAYELQGDSYVQRAQLVASDGDSNDGFGHAIAVQGDLAVIGAWKDDHAQGSDAGSAYVFQRSGGNWIQIAKLVAPGGATGDLFGSAVAVSTAGVLVGAPNDDIDGIGVNVGSAHLFQGGGGSWTAVVRLLASDAAGNARFGDALAASGSLAVVGADSAGNETGAAYVYRLDGAASQFEQMLVSTDLAAFDRLGGAVAISGSTAVVGARQHAGSVGANAGAAYVFQRSGQSWNQLAKLQPSDLQAGDRFGLAVAITDQAIVIGAPQTLTGACCEQGLAHLYQRSGNGWLRVARLNVSDAASYDQLGSSVAIAAERALAGAPGSNDPVSGALDAGSVVRFQRGIALFASGFETP